jgi:hypothetical protein
LTPGQQAANQGSDEELFDVKVVSVNTYNPPKRSVGWVALWAIALTTSALWSPWPPEIHSSLPDL